MESSAIWVEAWWGFGGKYRLRLSAYCWIHAWLILQYRRDRKLFPLKLPWSSTELHSTIPQKMILLHLNLLGAFLQMPPTGSNNTASNTLKKSTKNLRRFGLRIEIYARNFPHIKKNAAHSTAVIDISISYIVVCNFAAWMRCVWRFDIPGLLFSEVSVWHGSHMLTRVTHTLAIANNIIHLAWARGVRRSSSTSRTRRKSLCFTASTYYRWSSETMPSLLDNLASSEMLEINYSSVTESLY
jgi:hypothetical protein